MDKTSPILLRIFKEESQLEVWKVNQDGDYALLNTYPICRWSGALGPKKKEGDRQAPEGFYTITRGQMNPNSNYYLAFNTGYPNAFDRAWGRTGSELMVHGDCSSRGCYAMTDGQIQEIYALAREAFFGGQQNFQLQAYPFRMTALNMAKHRNNPNFAFWKELKQGYDAFEATHREPTVAVCEKRYVFDPAPPDGDTRPLHFNPRGKCPVYRLDPMVADAIIEHRRQEQIKMAEYIADGVAVQPIAKGADGGMNPVFADNGKLLAGQIDSDGRVYNVASVSSAPEAAPQAASQPVTMANVPLPERSPIAKPAPKPKSGIASLIGGLFGGGATASTAPAATESRAPARSYRNGGQAEADASAYRRGPGPAAAERNRGSQAEGGGASCAKARAGAETAAGTQRFLHRHAGGNQRRDDRRPAGGAGALLRRPLVRLALTGPAAALIHPFRILRY